MTPFRYDVTWQRAHVAAMLVVLVAGMAALVWRWVDRPLWLGLSLPVMPQRIAAAQEKINPNTAPVGSLRRLGGIGPVRAQAIVDYVAERKGTAFGRAEDLTAVKGIGPGTVERLRPYLVFSPTGD
jgi:competence protein ComEA